jgi:hypothetical protein
MIIVTVMADESLFFFIIWELQALPGQAFSFLERRWVDSQ